MQGKERERVCGLWHKAVEAVQARMAVRTLLGEVIPVRGKPVASCGDPASQTHNSAVAGIGHEFFSKHKGKRGSVQGQERIRIG